MSQWRSQPFTLVAEQANRVFLYDVSTAAEALGLTPGMMLSDARAAIPDILTAKADPHGDARFLKSLLRWATRASPLVARSSNDGLFLDSSGCDHLYGGETAMLTGLLEQLRRFGLEARGALCDTPGGAWALARYGTNGIVVPPGMVRDALAPLPIEALRLTSTSVADCRRLGLKTVADIINLPRASLAARFGLKSVQRLDQALGLEDEPIRPAQFRQAWNEKLVFPEPIGLTRDVMGGIELALERLCARMARKNMGIRQLRVTVTRVDHTREAIEIGINRPTRTIAALQALLTAPVDMLDARFGIERLEVAALQVDRLDEQQQTFNTSANNPSTKNGQSTNKERIAALVDTLSNRFGFDRVLRFAPAESHIPERGYTIMPAAFANANASWHPPETLRPARLLRQPEPLHHNQLIPPDNRNIQERIPQPPIQIFWRGAQRTIAPFAGPERIEPEWWHDDPQWRSGGRDYWWVRDHGGLALWLFSARNAQNRQQWFVHGFGA